MLSKEAIEVIVKPGNGIRTAGPSVSFLLLEIAESIIDYLEADNSSGIKDDVNAELLRFSQNILGVSMDMHRIQGEVVDVLKGLVGKSKQG